MRFLVLALFLPSSLLAALGESRSEVFARYERPTFTTRETTLKRSSAAEFEWRAYRVSVLFVDRISVREVFRGIASAEAAKKLLEELHPELEWKAVRTDGKVHTWESGVYSAEYSDRKLRLNTKGTEIDDPKLQTLPDFQ